MLDSLTAAEAAAIAAGKKLSGITILDQMVMKIEAHREEKEDHQISRE